MRKAQRSVRTASWSKSVGSGPQVSSQGVEYSLFANLSRQSRGGEGRRGEEARGGEERRRGEVRRGGRGGEV